MSKLLLSILICLLFVSCNSDDTDNSPLSGQTFVITSYVIETDVDLNGDGVFSNDLILENFISEGIYFDTFNDCLEAGQLYFEEEGIACPFASMPIFIVEDTALGEPEQIAICALFLCDGFSDYSINDDTIEFSFEDEIFKQGVFLNNTITITFSQDELETFELLNNEGTILSYNGSLTVTYTLQ
ncbi:hypothetical protein [Dokdonia sp.]|uniref:hypothetical protein n=1 Tax=Dokdonia sp. TaxID=2024995 RepID=UPI0032643263